MFALWSPLVLQLLQVTIARLVVLMPLQVIPPVKNAEYKVTLTTNSDAVQLVALFGDMLVQVGEGLQCQLSLV